MMDVLEAIYDDLQNELNECLMEDSDETQWEQGFYDGALMLIDFIFDYNDEYRDDSSGMCVEQCVDRIEKIIDKVYEKHEENIPNRFYLYLANQVNEMLQRQYEEQENEEENGGMEL